MGNDKKEKRNLTRSTLAQLKTLKDLIRLTGLRPPAPYSAPPSPPADDVPCSSSVGAVATTTSPGLRSLSL